jgi:protein-disulfide isomerase
VLAGRGFFCPYCIAVHVANLGFYVVLETRGALRAPVKRSVLAPVAGTVAVIALALALLHGRFAAEARARDERDLGTTTTALKTGAKTDAANGFAGRHRRGPENARARIVVFTDYQCDDCRNFEAELERVLAAAPDASLAIRYFPMCQACNPNALDLHPNACWAARAAEAASIVGGDAAFWRMHAWLFARHGGFTDVELAAGLAELGFDRLSFATAMHSETTLARVREDIDLGMRVGLESTPMIFVNGVELRGYAAPNALERVLAEVRSHPETAAVDQPPTARERFLDEWRTAPRTPMPYDSRPHVLGRADAPVSVVVFGDYQEAYTCEVDVLLRSITLADPRVSYTFRCFPANSACNNTMEKDLHPKACLAVLGAEAAGIMQGEDGFWAMHDWLMTHRESLDDGTLTAAAEELGMMHDDFLKAIGKPEIQFWMADDVRAARELALTQIPLIFVDGRRVGRWKAGDENLLPAMIAEAAR